MSKYDIILDKLEENPNVPMIFGEETISFSELKDCSENTEKFMSENSDMPLDKKNFIMMLSDSYRERTQNKTMPNEKSYQKTLANVPYMNNKGFIDIALFFFTVLTSALSIVTIMLFIIKMFITFFIWLIKLYIVIINLKG